MANVIPFRAAQRRAARGGLSSEIRAKLEEAAQAALDTADRIIAVLDLADADPDREDSGDADPNFGAPEEGQGSQLVWFKGSGEDRKIEGGPCA